MTAKSLIEEVIEAAEKMANDDGEIVSFLEAGTLKVDQYD